MQMFDHQLLHEIINSSDLCQRRQFHLHHMAGIDYLSAVYLKMFIGKVAVCWLLFHRLKVS